jgi:hypothetical protein
MVQITPDNQNLLMNFETFHQVIMSLARKNIKDEEKEEHMTTTLGYIFNVSLLTNLVVVSSPFSVLSLLIHFFFFFFIETGNGSQWG